MKFVSNILLATVLVVYLFLPFFDLGLFGSRTGYAFTENVLNTSTSPMDIIFSLLPFIGCFVAIIFNCMKHWAWSIISLVFTLVVLLFYYFAIDYKDIGASLVKIIGVGTGYNIGIYLLWGAIISTLLSFIPFSKLFKQKNI